MEENIIDNVLRLKPISDKSDRKRTQWLIPSLKDAPVSILIA